MRTRGRARRRQAAPLPTSSLVEGTLKNLHLDDAVRGLRALRAFSEVAGPRVRARARAERLRGQTLYVRVATAAWSHELHILKDAILERLHATPGGEEVHALRFQVGPLEEVPAWDEAPPPAAVLHGPAPAPAAPAPLAAPVVDALAAIVDDELRTRLERWMDRAASPVRR